MVIWRETRVYHFMRYALRVGQVRSEVLTSTFRTSCCSARLSRAQVPTHAGTSVQDRKRKGEGRGGGGPALSGYKIVQAVRSGSVAGGGGLGVYGICNVPWD